MTYTPRKIPVYLTHISWLPTAAGLEVYCITHRPAKSVMFASNVRPTERPRYVYRRGLRIRCGTIYGFLHYWVIDPADPGFTRHHHFLITQLVPCDTWWFYLRLGVPGKPMTGQSLVYTGHFAGVYLPFWEPWDAGLTGNHPWEALTFYGAGYSFQDMVLLFSTGAWSWPPAIAILRYGGSGPPIDPPFTLPRYLIINSNPGPDRDPAFAFFALTFNPHDGVVYHLRYWLEGYPYDESPHLSYRTLHTRMGYGNVHTDLHQDWDILRATFSDLPPFTAVYVWRLWLEARTSDTRGPISPFFRNAFIGLVDELPDNWPWLPT